MGKNTLGNTIKESLNDDFQSIDILGLSVLHVKVEPLLPLNNNDFSENGSVRLLDDEKSVVVSIIVGVEYIPPPQIDFDYILKKSIQNEGEAMLQSLTNSGDEFFSDLKYITTNAPTLAPQAMDLLVPENDSGDKTGIEDPNIILDERDKDVIKGDPDIILDEEDKGVIEEDPDVVLEEEDSKVGMIMAILFSILAALASGFAAIYFLKKNDKSKKVRNYASNNYVDYLSQKEADMSNLAYPNKELDVITEDDFASVMTDPTYRGGAIATKSRDDQDTYAPTYSNNKNEDDFASVMTDPTYRGGAMATKSRNDEDTYASIYEDETSSRSRFSNQSNGVQSHYSQLSKYQLSRNRNREGRMNDRDAHSEESEKAGSFVGRFIYREDSQSVDSSLPSTRGVENSWYTGEGSVQKSSVTNSSTIDSSRGFSEGSIQNSFNSNNSSINDASKTSHFTRESDQTHTQPCNSLRSLVSTEDLSQSASHSVSTYSKLTQSESSLLSNRKKYVSHINSTKRSGSIASFSTATSEPSFATKTNQEDDLLSVKNISTTVSDPLPANERKVSNDFKHEIGDTSVALLRPNDNLSQSHQLEEKDSSSLIPISQELSLPQTSLINTTPQALCSILGEGLNRRASFPIVGHDR